jgi:uncharacterized protein
MQPGVENQGMKVGILSDTHDQVRTTRTAVGVLVAEGAEVLIHCGDLTGPEIVYECAGLPSYYVFGNNDFDESGLRRAMQAVGGTCMEFGGVVELAGRRIAVTHGDISSEMRKLSEQAPDYLLFGHSHQPADRRREATRWINPGALYRAKHYTVAVLDLATDEVRFVKIR